MEAAALLIKILDLLVVGTAALERLQQLREKIADMVAEGREPSAEEWNALLDDVDASTARLEAANARLNKGDPE